MMHQNRASTSRSAMNHYECLDMEIDIGGRKESI